MKKILFEGREFPCPCDVHSYLTDLYGDYMTVPPVGKREFHAVFILPELQCNNQAYGPSPHGWSIGEPILNAAVWRC